MTIWTDYLIAAGAKLGDDACDFGDPTAHPDALARGALAVPLSHLGQLRATGEDAASFLHNMFSNDVANLPVDTAQWNSFNTPNGRMLASLLLWRDAAGHSLTLAADLAPALLAKLSKYVLRSKVKLSDASLDRARIGLVGHQAGEVLKQAALPCPAAIMHCAASGNIHVIQAFVGAYFLDLPADEAPALFEALKQAGAEAAGTADWQLAMVRAGIPHVTAATTDAFVPQMLNFELIGGVSFKKGCYPGQEIITRAQHIGKVKRRLYRLAFPGGTDRPTPGANLFAEAGESVGTIINAVALSGGESEALAVIHSNCVDAGNEIRLGGARARMLNLPYTF
ncbi:MAG: folate-binding protein [Azoarcus sp.]|nr:folate-binding protein [Azoarcus sp.]